jgi:hypothetical protein
MQSQDGFVLPLTLWVVAAIGLAVVAVNEWVSRAVGNAQILYDRVQAETEAANIQNELIFAIGTQPMTYRGLEVGRLREKVDRTDPSALMAADYQTTRYIRMDGREYAVESSPDYIIQIYDGRGLINLNATSTPYLRRLLGLFEVSEAERNGLVDALEDYVDRDDLTRISGAEVKEYTSRERLPPTNAWLMTPLEAQYVLGWDKVSRLWERELAAPLLSTCSVTGFNPNTASREAILGYFPGVMETDLAAIMERRERRLFRNVREFAAAAQTVIRDDPFFYTFSPGACVIVELTHRPTGARSRFSLTIDTFSAKTKPWRIDYAFPIPNKSKTAVGETPPKGTFPSPNTLDANQRAEPDDLGAGEETVMDTEPFDDTASDF